MVAKKISTLYSLRKSKKILKEVHRHYCKKAKVLDPHAKEKIESHLLSLQTALLQKDGKIADHLAHQLQEAAEKLIPKSFFDRIKNFVIAVGFALIIAIVIRQMWFELYTIPSGSMRPTLKESDFLIVSKTNYGLNVPLKTSHFYFDPTLVQHGDIIVFTGENMDIPDSDTVYFYLFPGKKQFVKRLLGKPGDTLYFYGGEIYGISAQGNDLQELRNAPWAENLEHIPFIRFDGNVETPTHAQGFFTTSTFYQMNEPIAKLQANPLGGVTGEMISQKGKAPLSHYSDLWGFKNYAMARLLSESEVEQIHPGALKDLEKGILYLELIHHPSLKEGRIEFDEKNRMRPNLGFSTSLIPLQEHHLKQISKHMITCRFTVKDGALYRIGFNGKESVYSRFFPHLSNVPDGTYEIQDGKVYREGFWPGKMNEVSSTHPLYNQDPLQIQLLYNLGFEFLTQYSPAKNGHLLPSRYAYFRNHELYLLGAPIFKKDDPALIRFLKREYQKQSISTSVHPYLPFDDAGAPITKEGKIDVDFIRKYGLVIPEKMYLALGDNHAMSADSRQFGFVPQDNIKGSVGFLFSPPGPRWGKLPQPTHSPLTFPNLFVVSTALFIGILTSLYNKKRLEKPLKFPRSTPPEGH